jgi:hypothetical protein
LPVIVKRAAKKTLTLKALTLKTAKIKIVTNPNVKTRRAIRETENENQAPFDNALIYFNTMGIFE